MKKKPIIYLASPYSHRFRIVRWWRARQIRRIMARVINEQDKIVPFSPIALTHDLDHLCPGVKWVEDFDVYLLGRFDGMIVVKLPGWDRSVGIKRELNFCFEHSIPYAYAKPENILQVCKQMKEICNAKSDSKSQS